MLTRDEIYTEGLPASEPSRRVLAFALAHAGATVVDLGCGYGAYALRLQERGRRVTGVEVNPEYAAEARARGIEAITADAAETPFPADSFDTALLIEVLEHVPEPERVLAEALRIARGNVLVTVPNVAEYAHLAEYAVTYWHLVTTDHVNFFTPAGLAALAERCGASVDIVPSEPLEPLALVPPRRVAWYALAVLQRLKLLKPVAYNRLYAVLRKRGA